MQNLIRKQFLQFSILLFALTVAGCDSSTAADRIFLNGQIITVDGQSSTAEALAVKNGRIVALGSREDVATFQSNSTQVIDLAGNTMLPGFVAAHEHPAISAVFRDFIDLSGFSNHSAEDAMNTLRQAIEATPRGNWVYAMGLDPVLLPGLAMPDRQQLDKLAPDSPVFILAQSMHTAWVNSAALAAMGIDEQSPDPGEGSYYGRDNNGRLNGVLIEKPALEPFLAPHKSPLKVIAAYENELIDLRKAGYTSVASLGFNMPAWLAKWASSDNLEPRIRQFFYYRGENLEKLSATPQTDSDYFRVLGGKFWYDGSPYSGSMLVETPYLDSQLAKQLGIAHDSHGEAVISKADLRQKVSALHDRGWQLAIHVQGDRAAKEFLDILQETYQSLTPQEQQRFTGRRHRLEHGLLLQKSQLPELTKLGITPSFHINHLYYYGDALREQLLGDTRTEQILPLKSAFQLNMHPTVHADSPMFPAEPFSLMQTAITRTSRSGTPIGIEQAISREQALRTMTINAAWQLGMEKEIGSLEVGKYADLVVVDKNPLEAPPDQWRDIRVVKTWIAGRE